MKERKLHPRKDERPPLEGKTYDFLHADKALQAYEAAREVVERCFGMDPERLVLLEGTRVTVPAWFPYEPLPLYISIRR